MNILFEKFHEKNKFFNPPEFFEKYDNEKYFELLIDWKKKHENYLEEKPYLNRIQIRHKKILGKPRQTIRGKVFFFNFIFFLEPLSYYRYFYFRKKMLHLSKKFGYYSI